MLQAITTRFHGPTNYRGSRVSARAQCGRRFYDWDHALNSDQNHQAAARAFAEEWGWSGTWYSGTAHDGEGVHVRLAKYRDPSASFTIEDGDA